MPRTTSRPFTRLAMATFEDLDAPPRPAAAPAARSGDGPHPLPPPGPDRSRGLAGWPRTSRGSRACALAIRREDIWGLSLLIVRPDQQSTGLGRALLRRANEYADGARGRIILSSPDPRALRAYSRLGLEIHPCAGRRRRAARRARCRTGSARAARRHPVHRGGRPPRARRRARRRHRRAARDGPDAADRARPRLRGHRRRRAAAARRVRRGRRRAISCAPCSRTPADGKAIVSWITVEPAVGARASAWRPGWS